VSVENLLHDILKKKTSARFPLSEKLCGEEAMRPLFNCLQLKDEEQVKDSDKTQI